MDKKMNKLFIIALSALLLFSACKDDVGVNPIEEKIIVELIPGHNNSNADRINLVFVGIGYDNMNQFLTVANRDIAYDGNAIIDSLSIEKIKLGLFAIEPFKSNKNKFNLWYYPQIWVGPSNGIPSPFAFIQKYRDEPSAGKKDFGLKYVSYMFFTNPDAEPQSFAIPGNITSLNKLIKEDIIFGYSALLRYPNIDDGMPVLAHELGHALFNLRDEYTRVGAEFPDKYGFNIARSLNEAEQLWGNSYGEIDNFYYEWKNLMIDNGFWIDKSKPKFVSYDPKIGDSIFTWYPDTSEISVKYIEGGGITSTGISWRPTITSLMSNEDIWDKSAPKWPPVFGSANRFVMESVLSLFSGL